MDSTANNSICEAMACGIPVITSDIGGIKDYVSEEFGILCPVNDYQAIAAAATQMLSSSEKSLAMGEAARLKAENNLCWDKIAEQIIEVLLAAS
jgi:glycosyltransferase involved in cell wall biosynthesis